MFNVGSDIALSWQKSPVSTFGRVVISTQSHQRNFEVEIRTYWILYWWSVEYAFLKWCLICNGIYIHQSTACTNINSEPLSLLSKNDISQLEIEILSIRMCYISEMWWNMSVAIAAISNHYWGAVSHSHCVPRMIAVNLQRRLMLWWNDLRLNLFQNECMRIFCCMIFHYLNAVVRSVIFFWIIQSQYIINSADLYGFLLGIE